METNKCSRGTNSPTPRKVLLLAQSSMTSVHPIRRGLIKGRGCILAVSRELPRQRVRSSLSHWGSQGQGRVSCCRLGLLGSGLSLPHQVQGSLRTGAVSPHHTMTWSPGIFISFSAGNVPGNTVWAKSFNLHLQCMWDLRACPSGHLHHASSSRFCGRAGGH